MHITHVLQRLLYLNLNANSISSVPIAMTYGLVKRALTFTFEAVIFVRHTE